MSLQLSSPIHIRKNHLIVAHLPQILTMLPFILLILSISISNANSITFDSANRTLFNTTVSCGTANDCSIYCRSAYSCDWLIINATLATNLNIECEDYYSCGYRAMTVYGNNITINCSDWNSCTSANISVSSSNPSGGLVLNCNGGMSCEFMTLDATNYFSRYIYIIIHPFMSRADPSHFCIVHMT